VEEHNKHSIFCPMITPTDHGGGIKSTITLMNGLQSLGHQVTLVVPKNCEYLGKLNPAITILFFKTTPTISLSLPIRYIMLCQWIKKQFSKYNSDTVYFCSDRPALMLALLLSKKTRLYYVSRGWFYTNWSAVFLRWFVFRKVSVFVGISHKQYQLMQRYASNPKNVYLIENGISIPNQTVIPFQNSCFQLAIIGGICKRKNQWQAICLIQLLNPQYPVKLSLYGTTVTAEDERYKAMLERIIRQNHLEDCIEFKEYEADLALIYSQTDIVISTATEEGFGRTLIEAMSYGVPVIASDQSGGPSTIIRHLSDGLLYDGSLYDLLAKTNQLIGDSALRNTIINNALQKVKHQYTDAIMCEKYSNIIEHGS
jgi:glycosyltransferase involved in cell wall biosynthesis